MPVPREILQDLRLQAGLPGVLRLVARPEGGVLIYSVLGHVYSTDINGSAAASPSAYCDDIIQWAVGKHGEAVRANRVMHDTHARRCLDFWGAEPHGAELLLWASPHIRLEGERSKDLLGTLPQTPAIDLNGDWIDDLLIGASGANDDAGTVYVAYGTPRRFDLPPSDEIFTLLNRTITGRADGGRVDDHSS